MGAMFTPRETAALYRLLAEDSSDVIVKTDRIGIILHASPGLRRTGAVLAGEAEGRNLTELFHPSTAGSVGAKHGRAADGCQDCNWIEARLDTGDYREAWVEVQMRCLTNDTGDVYGVVCVMRSIEERRGFERQLFVASMTDSLTGLTNRRAFIAMLKHLVERRIGGSLALFDIDHLRAINGRYGQAAGDEVVTVFAELVRTMMRSRDIISRIGGESLGVLLPDASPAQAEAICRRIVSTLAELKQAAAPGELAISASAGVARIGPSLDDTIARADLALSLAKAKGRGRLETAERAAPPWPGSDRIWSVRALAARVAQRL